jgi:uncharacterized protein YjiS (DUF1127 family)
MDRSPDGHLEILVVASLAWRIEQAAISALSSMSDRALRHIGLTRSGIPRAVMGDKPIPPRCS